MPPKRPTPSRSYAPNKLQRRATLPAAARAIKEVSELSEEDDDVDDVDDEMKAKLARKEARVSYNFHVFSRVTFSGRTKGNT